MIASAEAPESAPPPSWLDRWFEPPWGAFLSWIALAAAMGWVFQHGGGVLIWRTVIFLFDHLDTMLPARLPPTMRTIAGRCNEVLLLFWFEPFVLRLNFLRGLAWLSLRCGIFAAVAAFLLLLADWGPSLSYGASSVLAGAVLVGWRTRPWMSVPGGVLMAAMIYCFTRSTFPIAQWLWTPAITFSYAAALIFGTRLIPRAARETPGSGRLRW